MGTEINQESRFLLKPSNAVQNIKAQAAQFKVRFNMFSGNSNNLKIRRLYYLFVKKNTIGIILKSSDTPFETIKKIVLKHKNISNKDTAPEKSGAAKIYEKARYGNLECDESDVKSIKNALK